MRQKPLAAIFDMDGTLCDVRKIRYIVTADPKHRNFHKFHSASIDCPPFPEVLQLYHTLQNAGLYIVIVTARTEDFSFLTNLWLKEHNIVSDALYMRSFRDHRPDHEVKQQLLSEILQQYSPIIAVDDRIEIAEVWQSNEIQTIIVEENGTLNYNGVSIESILETIRNS